MIEGWIDKASNQLQVAREHLKSYTRSSEVIQAGQESIELSVKSILTLLDVQFSPTHGWTRGQFEAIAKQIYSRRLPEKLAGQNLQHAIRLPRLLLLANFWAQFYLPAKYGFEAGYLAPAQDLFAKDEADLAVKHAEECYRAASHVRYLPKDKLLTPA